MTANVDIKRGDLHLAVSTALNRGRYVLTTAGGDGQPVEITIDLRERPDDLFEAEAPAMVPDRILTEGGAYVHVNRPADAPRREDIGKWRPFEIEPVTDDHGASIPAQGEHYREPIETGAVPDPRGGYPWRTYEAGPRVYEFALQDFDAHRRGLLGDVFEPLTLDQIDIVNAEGFNEEAVAAADWVHVYDRVTRERRTLKRPAPDPVLTGLRDVAADLRKPDRVLVCDGPVRFETVRGVPVDPPFGCAALPPVGPLTSTEGLRVGDMVRCLNDNGEPNIFGHVGRAYAVRAVNPPYGVMVDTEDRPHMANDVHRFAFVGRPDADGWMAWAGGENPVPGATVEFRTRRSLLFAAASDPLHWTHNGADGDIVAFRIIDAAKGKEDAS